MYNHVQDFNDGIRTTPVHAIDSEMPDVHECGFCGGDGGDHALAGTLEGDTGYICLGCALDWLAGPLEHA